MVPFPEGAGLSPAWNPQLDQELIPATVLLKAVRQVDGMVIVADSSVLRVANNHDYPCTIDGQTACPTCPGYQLGWSMGF